MAVCLAKRSTRVSSSRCSSSTINTHLSRRRHRNGSAIIVTRAQQSSRDEDLSSMDMGELVRAMEVAAASELYSEASAYRDEYNARLQTVVGQVEDCNARFYKAFSMSDIGMSIYHGVSSCICSIEHTHILRPQWLTRERAYGCALCGEIYRRDARCMGRG